MSNVTVYDEGNNSYPVEFISFSDGCENCQLPEALSWKIVNQVVVMIEDSARDIIRTALVKDALDRNNCHVGRLVMSYLPNARADRVFLRGNAFPLEVTTKLLDSLGFEEIHITDPHSLRSREGFKRSKLCVTEAHTVFNNLYRTIKRSHKDVVLISPDKGSLEKCAKISGIHSIPLLAADKVRDLQTGRVLSIDLEEGDLADKTAVIFDDICDGGGTFIPLAIELKRRGAAKVVLSVSHGIFSRGLDVLEDIDELYVYNHVGTFVNTFDVQKFNRRGK